MKIALARLEDFSLQAQDGEIGSVHDVLFEDDLWLMRYLVADTGGFLFGRKVLLAPAALLQPQAGDTAVPVCLTRDEVKDSPDIKADLPLSRDQEVEYHDYFRWPYYWGGGPYVGAYMTGVAPEAMVVGSTDVEPDSHPVPPEKRNPRLFSARDTRGYRVFCGEEKVGSLKDFVLETEDWSTPLLVVELDDDSLRLVPVEAVEKLDWPETDLVLRPGIGALRSATAYASGLEEDGRFIEGLYAHYGVQRDPRPLRQQPLHRRA